MEVLCCEGKSLSIIKDSKMSKSGQQKISWAASFMPVLHELTKIFAQERPFAGLRIALSIHLEAKTAQMVLALRDGGAEVSITGCNPLSTQDDIVAALASEGVAVYAKHGVSMEEYEAHLTKVLASHPHLVLDDGGDLVALLHGKCISYSDVIIGGTEETTTGVHRLRLRARSGELHFPMLAVNDANCKHLFDNRYGTGQSTWESLMHTTNVQITGKTVVVAGYGWCGRGVAMRAAGLGSRVIVTEIDPVKAIEAAMDGFVVMPMDQAAPLGDIFLTVTGCKDVIARRHMEVMKNDAILANAGHFDVEISLPALHALAEKTWKRRENITGFQLKDGRILNLLADGRLVNLASGNGHPVEIMDMSFSVQTLSLLHMARHGAEMSPGIYNVPPEIDNEIARRKLRTMGVDIDLLTQEQERYLNQY
jgi:adenosylhomocysteinase